MADWLDEQVEQQVLRLTERFESYLPKGWGVMVWVYSTESEHLEVQAFHSHESTAETLRIIRATASKMIQRDARQQGVEELQYEAPSTHSPGEVVISGAAVTRSGAHDRVRVWSRGGLAGELIVKAGDGAQLCSLLLLEPV